MYKIRYVTSLTGILRTICDAGDKSEDHAEAIRQVEWSLLDCIQRTAERSELDNATSNARHSIPMGKTIDDASQLTSEEHPN